MNRWLLPPLALALMAAAVSAEEPLPAGKPTLTPGDPAPDFELPETGEAGAKAPEKLSGYQGRKNVVVAFYPRVFTPGCTKQMCGYRDDFAKFQERDAEIIAISVDPQSESDRFKKEHKFPFAVVGDEDGHLRKAYGVPAMEWQDQRLAQRSVFLVDKKGVVRYADLKYDIAKGQDALLAKLDEINGKSAKVAPVPEVSAP